MRNENANLNIPPEIEAEEPVFLRLYLNWNSISLWLLSFKLCTFYSLKHPDEKPREGLNIWKTQTLPFCMALAIHFPLHGMPLFLIFRSFLPVKLHVSPFPSGEEWGWNVLYPSSVEGKCVRFMPVRACAQACVCVRVCIWRSSGND